MTFEQAGIAAMLPGMVHLQELMAKEIERMKRILGAAQNGNAPEHPTVPAGKGNHSESGYWSKMTPEERSEEMRRRYYARGKSPIHSYWAGMTSEERRAEMKRRRKVAAKKARAAGRTASKGGASSPNHPSNPNHPAHEEWRQKMKTVAKKGAAA